MKKLLIPLIISSLFGCAAPLRDGVYYKLPDTNTDKVEDHGGYWYVSATNKIRIEEFISPKTKLLNAMMNCEALEATVENEYEHTDKLKGHNIDYTGTIFYLDGSEKECIIHIDAH